MKTKKPHWKKLPTGVYTRVVNGKVEVKTEAERQYRSHQGKSTRQRQENYKIMFWSLMGLFICMLYIALKN